MRRHWRRWPRRPAPPANVHLLTKDLENDTTLTWEASPGGGDGLRGGLARDDRSPEWEHVKSVGNVTRATLKISKDNVIFAVRAVDTAGHAVCRSCRCRSGRVVQTAATSQNGETWGSRTRVELGKRLISAANRRTDDVEPAPVHQGGDVAGRNQYGSFSAPVRPRTGTSCPRLLSRKSILR